jgi:hypothetical protein
MPQISNVWFIIPRLIFEPALLARYHNTDAELVALSSDTAPESSYQTLALWRSLEVEVFAYKLDLYENTTNFKCLIYHTTLNIWASLTRRVPQHRCRISCSIQWYCTWEFLPNIGVMAESWIWGICIQIRYVWKYHKFQMFDLSYHA